MFSASPEVLAAFAARLRSAGYSARGVRNAIGSGAAVSVSPAELPAVQRRLGRSSPLRALIELFLLGVEVPTPDAEAAVAPMPLTSAIAAGLIEQRGDVVRARIRVLPHEDLLVACDRDPELDGRLEAHHVGGIHASSVLLARITPRRPVERALDIGCGCGIQALLLARHARHVVASDVNPRALEFGRLNAKLNAIENISWRLGDGLEPIRGDRFDLVVSNPPYVIAPQPRYTFRESPLPGDAFCERLVRAVPEVLNDDGVACLLASWIVGAGEAWPQRPVEWTAGLERGRLLLHLETVDATENAVRWAVPPGSISREAATALVREWLDYYGSNEIVSVAYGAVILHPSPALTRVELAATPGPEGPAHIERIIEGHRLLARGAPETMLDAVLKLAPRHRLDWTLEAGGGSWQLRRSQLSIAGGLGLGVQLDRPTAQVLAKLDGRHTLRELLGEASRDAPLDRLAELLRAGLISVSAAR